MYLKNTQIGFDYNKYKNFGKDITNVLKKQKLNDKSKINQLRFSENNLRIGKQKVFNLNKNFLRKEIKNKEEEYFDEIYNYCYERKIENNDLKKNLEKQNEINSDMRIILLEWLIDVVFHFKIKMETFFICIYLVDEYISKRKIKKENYQLLGATSLFMATKFNEIYPPELNAFIKICDNAYNKYDFLKMEEMILTNNNFIILNINHFELLNLEIKKLNLNESIKNKAIYYLFISILNSENFKFNYNELINTIIKISSSNFNFKINIEIQNKINYNQIISNITKFENLNDKYIFKLKRKFIKYFN